MHVSLQPRWSRKISFVIRKFVKSRLQNKMTKFYRIETTEEATQGNANPVAGYRRTLSHGGVKKMPHNTRVFQPLNDFSPDDEDIARRNKYLRKNKSKKDEKAKSCVRQIENCNRKIEQENRRSVIYKLRKKKRDAEARLEQHSFFENIGVARRVATNHFDDARTIIDSLESLKEAIKYKGSEDNDFMENMICRIEDIGALMVALLGCSSYASFLSIIHMYIRTHYTKSTGKVIVLYIRKLFESDGNVQGNSGKLHQHDKEDEISPEEQIENFKKCIRNWKEMRDCAFSKKVGELLNILTTFGWLDLDENPIKIRSFELFKAKVWDVQKNAFDFIDVIIETVLFFVERGYLAYVKGDFSLLLYDDSESMEFEREYTILMSVLPLIETGRLEDLKSEKIKDEAEFEERLEKLITRCYMMNQNEKNPIAKNVLANKLLSLKNLRSKLIMLQKETPIRQKPYGVSIYGGSAVGKSMLNSIITKVILQRNGFDSSKKFVVTLNDSDPYQSEYRTYHTAVTLDDFGNTRAEHYESSPTAKIIDFLNNVPKAALSPIAELKGNVMIRPKLVSVTTNVKKLMSNIFSNEPVSILRRFEVHLDVKLRPEWIDPQTGGINTTKIGEQIIPDAWLITLQQIRIIRTQTPGRADNFEFVDIMRDASIFEVLDWITAHSKTFYAQQAQFVYMTEQFYDKEVCSHYHETSSCPICNLEQHGLYATGSPEDLAPLQYWNAEPESWDENMTIQDAVSKWYTSCGLDYAVTGVVEKCDNLREAFNQHKTSILQASGILLGSVGLVYSAIKLFQTVRRSTVMLTLQDREDGIPIKVSSDHENNWKKIEYGPIPTLETGMTRSGKEFEDLLRRRLARCTVYDYTTNKQKSCNIFPIQGNTWLLPSHMIIDDHDIQVHVRQGRGDAINRVFTERIDKFKYQRFSDDFMLIRLVKGGPIPNTLDMIAADEYPFTVEMIHMLTKDSEGVNHRYTAKVSARKTFQTVGGNLYGICYNLPTNTEKGMCMAPVYTERTPRQIIGFHLAGQTGKPFGVAGHINVAIIKEAMMKLDAKNDMQCHSEGHFPIGKYGFTYNIRQDIPNNHALHTLRDDDDGQSPAAVIYGSHDKGRSFFKSNVRKSPISESVKKHLQIERDYGPPRREGGTLKHWLRDLELMAHPKGDFTPTIWQQARDDLRKKFTRHVLARPELMQATFPLAHEYVLGGADGIAAFSRIPLSTSMGWPINKAKNKYISPRMVEIPGLSEPIDFDGPEFMEEIERMKKELLNGRRVHTVFRGNLKDEAVKWTKDKIRVFAGSEVAFTYLVRKYYLPILRLMQNGWLDFECAVGINVHGPQWNELAKHITKFGLKRLMAGDFAHFDKSAEPGAMMSALLELIEIARLCGYTEDDLMIMRGLATEIAYPIYELDGVILQLFGSNPSGHPLTVVVNNIINSLYMRYAYYVIHIGEKVPAFDEFIALVCFGDDNIMNISEQETKFNMHAVHQVLRGVGIDYTNADKTEVTENTPFLNITEVDFLKRGFRFDKDFNAWVAPLAKSSIGKSLHNQMHNKYQSRESIAAQAIQSANREFAFHGREEFEKYKARLEMVMEECDIGHLVGKLETFDELLQRYYGNTEFISIGEDFVLDEQSGEVDFPDHTILVEYGCQDQSAMSATVIEIAPGVYEMPVFNWERVLGSWKCLCVFYAFIFFIRKKYTYKIETLNFPWCMKMIMLIGSQNSYPRVWFEFIWINWMIVHFLLGENGFITLHQKFELFCSRYSTQQLQQRSIKYILAMIRGQKYKTFTIKKYNRRLTFLKTLHKVGPRLHSLIRRRIIRKKYYFEICGGNVSQVIEMKNCLLNCDYLSFGERNQISPQSLIYPQGDDYPMDITLQMGDDGIGYRSHFYFTSLMECFLACHRVRGITPCTIEYTILGIDRSGDPLAYDRPARWEKITIRRINKDITNKTEINNKIQELASNVQDWTSHLSNCEFLERIEIKQNTGIESQTPIEYWMVDGVDIAPALQSDCIYQEVYQDDPLLVHWFTMGEENSVDSIDVPPLEDRTLTTINSESDLDELEVEEIDDDIILDFQADEQVIYEDSTQQQHQVLGFEDYESGHRFDMDDFTDVTRRLQDTSDVPLADFLSRPVRLHEFDWEINNGFAQSFDPWTEFLQNPRVANRIANYSMMRCKLHVKFMLNGTPFHYGRLMAAYEPLQIYNQAIGPDSFNSDDLVELSQKPNVLLNPTTSEGGELELPFFYPENYMRLHVSDSQDLGRILMFQLNSLKHVNSGTTGVTVSVFAWATDVELAVPTTRNPAGLEPQSTEENMDEQEEGNTKGMISGPATAIASAASHLKRVPFLAPYAGATEIAAKYTAAVAKIFGYSRPPITVDPEPFKPIPISSLALTTVPDGVAKLTMDDKQSLALDPRIAGVGDSDPMAILNIAKRESYLTTFSWSESDSPDNLLQMFRVHPIQQIKKSFDASIGGQFFEHHLTPLAFASIPFRYWTGSIRYRFQIVKSSFHRGRLRLSYDPIVQSTFNEFNLTYAKIIDISEVDDFTITVNFGQQRTWLNIPNARSINQNQIFRSTTSTDIIKDANGTLCVSVVNSLTTPSEVNAPVDINVFVSAGDDFRVSVPSHFPIKDFSPLIPPQEESIEVDSKDHDQELILDSQALESNISDMQGNEPVGRQESSFSLGPSSQWNTDIDKVFMGEAVMSFRTLLKRYVKLMTRNPMTESPSELQSVLPMYPQYRGFSTPSYHQSIHGGFNYLGTPYLNWVRLGFAGFRGGVRYKVTSRWQDKVSMFAERTHIGSYGLAGSINTYPAPHEGSNTIFRESVLARSGQQRSQASFGHSSTGYNGIAYQTNDVNPVMEYEVPFYSTRRFVPGKRLFTGTMGEASHLSIACSGSKAALFEIYVAAAEDFQVYFFTGTPRMYTYSDPTALNTEP